MSRALHLTKARLEALIRLNALGPTGAIAVQTARQQTMFNELKRMGYCSGPYYQMTPQGRDLVMDATEHRSFCFGCGFKHAPIYPDCVWKKNPY